MPLFLLYEIAGMQGDCIRAVSKNFRSTQGKEYLFLLRVTDDRIGGKANYQYLQFAGSQLNSLLLELFEMKANSITP